MKVVVTGGRDFNDRALLFRVLDRIHQETPITLIRNGGMTGADALSSRWAYTRRVDTECVGARWGSCGGRAGPLRNETMLARPTDLVVAFPGGRGTADAVRQAQRMDRTVIQVTPADA